ncbi:PREDICTED: uncharacterized protein LOC107604341 [Ficedula albicollis]|uniref:uncharacterized protein LOC107604341 n=1 Tax=Ficedula albicollis TaxID=59894 RepID=UPI0007AD8565|nr:PREDICTED: uncharacterized protein LOC107604341 [Ficedula albicollis]
MSVESMMSLVVGVCLYIWSMGFFEVLIPLWSLGLFAYPEIAPMLSLIRSFCIKGALTKILIGLGLVVMICRRVIRILELATGMYTSCFVLFIRGEAGKEDFLPLFPFLSSELVTSLVENIQISLNIKETIFLAINLVSFGYTVFSLYRIKAEISKGAEKTPDLGVKLSRKNPEWNGKWEEMGQILKELSDPIIWEFPPEQIQDPIKVARYLKKKCQASPKERRVITVSWALAHAYRTLLDSIERDTEERNQGDKLPTIPATQVATTPLGLKPAAKLDNMPQPMAVAASKRGGKCSKKTDRPVVDDDDDDDAGEGPSTPPDIKSGAKTTSMRAEANNESLSIKDLRGLRKDYTRRPDKSIISWLVRLWDAAGEATVLDGTEARHLGSLSHDPVIDQGVMREANPQSLWAQVLDGMAQRYLCADDLCMQQTRWRTIEQGVQRLREMAVAEMIFSDDITTRNPDLVPCTPVMWRKLVQLGPSEYASTLAIMKREEMYETVLDMAKKLRAYADTVHGPTHARIAAVETRLQNLEDKIEENHKKLREEIKEDLLQISAVQIRRPSTQRRRFSDGERRYTPCAELWFFLRDCGENMKRWDRKPKNMKRWDGKPTAALAQRVRDLKEDKTRREGSTRKRAAPVAWNHNAKYEEDDDMSDTLEGTSKTYAPVKKDKQA